MKKILLLISLLLGAALLAACASAAAGTATGEQASATGNPLPGTSAGVSGNMPPMQLALAVFQLEGTDYPLTTEQAATLLPLWKAARSLSRSDTAAAAETQAVMKQIQDNLTAEQLKALQETSFSPDDMATLAEKYGLQLGPGGGAGAPDSAARATMQAASSSGQAMPGGPGGPGGDPFGGGSPPDAANPQAMQTAQAGRSGSGGAAPGLNSSLLDAVIKFLETKAQ